MHSQSVGHRLQTIFTNQPEPLSSPNDVEEEDPYIFFTDLKEPAADEEERESLRTLSAYAVFGSVPDSLDQTWGHGGRPRWADAALLPPA